MLHRYTLAAGVSLAVLLTCLPALAAPGETSPEIQQLKDEIATLRQMYEARLQSLERRIAELQQPAPAPATSVSTGRATSAAAGRSAASAFNPAILGCPHSSGHSW